MALVQYSRQARKHWKNAEHKQSTMETAYSKERKQRHQAQSEVLNLKERIETSVKSEAKLKKWERREPAINHYLGLVAKMAK